MFRWIFGLVMSSIIGFGAFSANASQSGPYQGSPMSGINISIVAPAKVTEAIQAPVVCAYIDGMTEKGQHVNGGETFAQPFVLTQVSSPGTLFFSLTGGKVPGTGNIWLFKPGMDQVCAQAQAGNNKLVAMNSTPAAEVTVEPAKSATAEPTAVVINDDNAKYDGHDIGAVSLDGPQCTLLSSLQGAQGVYTTRKGLIIEAADAVFINIGKDKTGANVWIDLTVDVEKTVSKVNGSHVWGYYPKNCRIIDEVLVILQGAKNAGLIKDFTYDAEKQKLTVDGESTALAEPTTNCANGWLSGADAKATDCKAAA